MSKSDSIFKDVENAVFMASAEAMVHTVRIMSGTDFYETEVRLGKMSREDALADINKRSAKAKQKEREILREKLENYAAIWDVPVDDLMSIADRVKHNVDEGRRMG